MVLIVEYAGWQAGNVFGAGHIIPVILEEIISSYGTIAFCQIGDPLVEDPACGAESELSEAAVKKTAVKRYGSVIPKTIPEVLLNARRCRQQ